MRKLISSTLTFALFCNYSLAQDSANFSEKELPQVSVDDAPIKKLEINKSSIVTTENKDLLKNILLDKKLTSLMFDEDETTNIDRALDALKTNQQFIPELSDKERAASDTKSKEEEEKAKEKEIADNEKSFVYLASIMYFTANNWAVWINDKKITNLSNTDNQELYLSSVNSGSIKVLWKLSLSKWRILSKQRPDAVPPNLNENNQVEVEFELKPNQTFSLNTNKVSEGRALVALLKKKESETASTPQTEKK